MAYLKEWKGLESRSRASPNQFAALLDFMERQGDLARPQQGPEDRIRSDRLWQELAELLNSIGGVIRSKDKWKKVWVDWKAKTKKKALTMRLEAHGIDGGPSRQVLTDPEQRLLTLMGFTPVVVHHGIEDRGCEEAPSQRSCVPPPMTDSVAEFPSQISASDMIKLEVLEVEVSTTAPSSPATSEVLQQPGPRESPLPPDPASTQKPSATCPIAVTLRREPQPRQRSPSPSPVASPTTSNPRRRTLIRARRRRLRTFYERVTNEFAAVENRRLQLEEERERNNHEREMERLRLESRRIEMEDNREQTLCRLVGVLNNLSEILMQSRSTSLPTPDIL